MNPLLSASLVVTLGFALLGAWTNAWIKIASDIEGSNHD